MAKGDSITVHVDEGVSVRPIVVMARKSGRIAEFEIVNESKINWLLVTEKTRGGTLIHSLRIPVDRAVAIVVERRDQRET